MQRRRLLELALVPLLWAVGTGHTPYKQWSVYRKTHLLILTNKRQSGSFELGQALAAILAEHLPESRARAARAPHSERVASLLSSEQLDVALLPPAEAVAMLKGAPPFAGYGPTPLRSLATVDAFLLVCRSDFPKAHAYLISATLHRHSGELTIEPPLPNRERIPVHAGALEYWRSR